MANRIKLSGTTVPEFQVGLRGATISSEAVTSPYSLVLPPTLGTSGQALTLDTGGNLVFVDPAAGSIANGNASISVLSDGTVVLPDTGSFESPTMVFGESTVQMGSNLPDLRQSKVYVGMTAGQTSKIVALSSVTQTGGFAAGATVSGANLVENTVAQTRTLDGVTYFALDFEPSAVPQIGDQLTFTVSGPEAVGYIMVGADGYQDTFTPARLYVEYDPGIQVGDSLLDGYPYPYGTIITNFAEDTDTFVGQWYIETDQVPDTVPSYGDMFTYFRNVEHVDTGTVGSPAGNHLPYYNANGTVPSTNSRLNGANVTDQPITTNWVAINDGGILSGVITITPTFSIVNGSTYTAVYVDSPIGNSVIIGDTMSFPSVTNIDHSVLIGSNISGPDTTYDNSVSIGYLSKPDQSSVSVGSSANVYGSGGIAVGSSTVANYSSIALGQYANANGGTSISVGYSSTATGAQGIAIGTIAFATGANGIAIGRQTGASAADSIRMGYRTGISSPNATRSVAIGMQSGEYQQGANAIAIGPFAGSQSQANNSIVLNATGADLNNTTANSFVVKPVRSSANTSALSPVFYNTTTGEITSGNLTNVSTLTVSGVTTLGAVGNVKISNGANGQVLSTNGSGNLSWKSMGFGPFANTTSNTAVTISLPPAVGTWNQAAGNGVSEFKLSVFETTSVDSKPSLVGSVTLDVVDIVTGYVTNGFYMRVYKYNSSTVIGNLFVSNINSNTAQLTAYNQTPLFYNAKLYIR